MIYQENIRFSNDDWYLIEWEDIDFRDFDNIEGLKECSNIESLEKIVKSKYPNSNIKSTLIGKKEK